MENQELLERQKLQESSESPVARRLESWLAQRPIQLTGNNPQPSTILCLICIIDITIGPAPFTVTAENTFGVTVSFSGDCSPTAPGSLQGTGTIVAGKFQTCNINAG